MCDSRRASDPACAGATINRRVVVVDCLTQCVSRCSRCTLQPGFSHLYWLAAATGLRPGAAGAEPHPGERTQTDTIPLSVDQVARFWSSFRNARDLAIVGLMLLQGLRSKEVIALDCEDRPAWRSPGSACTARAIRLRLLPLASETIHLLDHYLRLERPPNAAPRCSCR